MTDGKSTLEKIIEECPPDAPYWNEAQNRFHFIDRLLTECLGWEKPNLQVEESDDSGGRADYCLGKESRVVLEAKRSTEYFGDLPPTTTAKPRKLKPLIENSESLKSAVQQVIQYCALRGAQTAAVCNGRQLIIFQSIIPGSSPFESECYFFNGLDSYLKHFNVLWRILSPEAVAENRAYRELSISRNPRIPPKASSAITEPLKYRYRSKMQEDLRFLASLLLEDVETNPDHKAEFYKDCYVETAANNRNTLLSKKAISARYDRATENSIASKDIGTEVLYASNSGSLELSDDVLAESISSRPFIVLGDVGVGKTSFFENLFYKLDSSDKKNTYFLHLDLGTKANLTDNLRTYILHTIPKTLKETYRVDILADDFVRGVYYEELNSFKSGIHGRLKEIDEEEYRKKEIEFLEEKISMADEHLKAAIGHIALGRSKKIVIIIDNTDQREFAIQQEAFLIAQELAETRNVLIFIALRPSTFFHSKAHGALSGYQSRVLTISPPPIDDVLKKRITFAVRVAEGKAAPSALEGIRLNLKNIILFLHALLRAVRYNNNIKRFIGNVTGGNVRTIIELISAFCGSPNVDSKKIVKLEAETSGYQIPLHEFSKHALLGEYAYYNALSSQVAYNVFDVSSADPKEHFLATLIIAYLSAPLGSKNSDGFVYGADIQVEMRKLGYIDDQIEKCARGLAKSKLIETPHSHFREIEVDSLDSIKDYYFRATSIGLYHINYWIMTFSFLDAMSIDTPIFDEEIRNVICGKAESFVIEDRLIRAEIFRSYLSQVWHESNLAPSYFDFVTISSSQSASFDGVRKAISGKGKKNKNRRSGGRRNPE